MRRPRWLVREAGSESSAPALVRGGAGSGGQTTDADGDTDNDGQVQDCPKCDDGLMADGTVCPTCGGSGKLERAREAELTSKARDALPDTAFVFPKERRYPIQDIGHARNALARSSGKSEESAVKAAVYKKYPSLKESAAATREQQLEGLVAAMTTRLREAKPEVVASTYAPFTSGTGDRYEVVLIREGKGNSEDGRYYTRGAISELVNSGVCEGMQAYSNHPTLDEEEFLPERSIRDLVGSYRDVRLAESATGLAEARATFVPIRGDGYEWVTTLAEAAISNQTGKPLVGISLYGAAAGEDRTRPDGSFGPVADIVRPTSGDIVTNAGAGGQFVKRLMESARAKRAARTDPPEKETNRMQLSELMSKIKESAGRLREADTDEKRTTALGELDELAKAEVELPEKPLDSLTPEQLKESQPQAFAKLRESATSEVREELKKAGEKGSDEKDAKIVELDGKLAESERKLRESEAKVAEQGKKIGQFDNELLGAKVLREAKVADEDADFYFLRFREAGASTEDAMRSIVKIEQEREARQAQRLRESMGLGFVEGNPGTAGGSSTEGLIDLSADGVPTKDPTPAADKDAAAAAAA